MNSDPWEGFSVCSNKGALLFLFHMSREGESERLLLSSALTGAWPPTVTSGLSVCDKRHF